MKTVQVLKEKNKNWKYIGKNITLNAPLVLVFGNRYLLEEENIYKEVKSMFPNGHIILGSTSGDITNQTVSDDSISITAIEFEKSNFIIKTSNVLNPEKNSFKTGSELIDKFPEKGLKYVLVLSEGSFVNGSELVKGLNSKYNDELLITGGLFGDDARFEKTIAGYNENPKEGEIIAIGFYGEDLEVSFSIHGGWTPFGPERIVTKSKSNKLFELDGMPALDLYKKYLGEKSNNLPGAALLYPLNVKVSGEKHSFVRTILNINEEENSMILAGDIPLNSKVQLMMASIDNIANASEQAAIQASEHRDKKAQLAILISCIGRKLVLDQRVEEEVEEVINIVGDNTVICGFYSYGEIAPFYNESTCQLHNQTMTITLISE